MGGGRVGLTGAGGRGGGGGGGGGGVGGGWGGGPGRGRGPGGWGGGWGGRRGGGRGSGGVGWVGGRVAGGGGFALSIVFVVLKAAWRARVGGGGGAGGWEEGGVGGRGMECGVRIFGVGVGVACFGAEWVGVVGLGSYGDILSPWRGGLCCLSMSGGVCGRAWGGLSGRVGCVRGMRWLAAAAVILVGWCAVGGFRVGAGAGGWAHASWCGGCFRWGVAVICRVGGGGACGGRVAPRGLPGASVDVQPALEVCPIRVRLARQSFGRPTTEMIRRRRGETASARCGYRCAPAPGARRAVRARQCGRGR